MKAWAEDVKGPLPKGATRMARDAGWGADVASEEGHARESHGRGHAADFAERLE